MKAYISITVILYCAVNYLLLSGIGRFLGKRIHSIRYLSGVFISGIYVLLCLLFPSSGLSAAWIYLLSVILTGVSVFGIKNKGLILCLLYTIFYVSLGGISIGGEGLISLTLSTIGIMIVFFILPAKNYPEIIPMQLRHDGKQYNIHALRDTGNMLTDPISGQPVLIVSAELSKALTGLNPEQLRKPLESISLVPGLRLIPYKTVGQARAFLLAMRIDCLEFGSRKGSAIIALSPENLSKHGAYQALAGGYL